MHFITATAVIAALSATTALAAPGSALVSRSVQARDPSFFSDIGDAFKDTGEEIVDTIVDIADDAGDWIDGAADTADSWFDDAGNWVDNAANDLGDWFEENQDDIVAAVEANPLILTALSFINSTCDSSYCVGEILSDTCMVISTMELNAVGMISCTATAAIWYCKCAACVDNVYEWLVDNDVCTGKEDDE